MPPRLRSDVVLLACIRFSFQILSPNFYTFKDEFFEEPLLGRVWLTGERPRCGLFFILVVLRG